MALAAAGLSQGRAGHRGLLLLTHVGGDDIEERRFAALDPARARDYLARLVRDMLTGTLGRCGEPTGLHAYVLPCEAVFRARRRGILAVDEAASLCQQYREGGSLSLQHPSRADPRRRRSMESAPSGNGRAYGGRSLRPLLRIAAIGGRMSAAVRYPRPPELDQLGTRHAVVEASAGTGKTYLLEHLVVELLLNHEARMEEILVVTFTERATAELCLRLRKKLSELCHLSTDHPAAAGLPDQECWLIDETARGRLRDALLALDRATISTIHGFCLGILEDHAFLHQRMFDEQAVDENDAFHTAFVETLRNDFAVQSELLPYLRAWLATGRSAADLERALGACATELARLFPSRPEALRPDFDAARAGRGHRGMAGEGRR